MGSPVLITPATAGLLDVASAKAHLRVTDNAEDGYIQQLIDVATDAINGPSGLIGRAILTSTWRQALDEWPEYAEPIVLPLPPLQSVTSITYVDQEGITQTLAPADYQLVNSGDLPSVIWPAYGKIWPTIRSQAAAITIQFVAGWTGPEKVPARIRQAALVMIGFWFDHRDALGQVPDAADHLLRPLMVDIGGRWVG